uniref:J domain-containing protein n=1 Tax=Oryza glumipatula TaxID=40148 RepID=A0A0E0A689_9ORYZ
MARGGAGGGADADLYAVLGLSRECTDADLRLAYRKLAMIWHPDRCSVAGGSASAAGVDEAKERFQEIQGAYSVLSDSNKRFLYDVGVYDGNDGDDDDDEADLSGMGDFLGEMAQMMSQATPAVSNTKHLDRPFRLEIRAHRLFFESFEELQQLFVDMFQDDIDAGLCQSTPPPPSWPSPPAAANARSPAAAATSRKGVNKRCSPAAMDMESGLSGLLGISGFCFEAPWTSQDASTAAGGGGGKRRKQRPPAASHNV